MPISLEGLDAENVGAHAELWEEVVRRVGSGLMPPLGSRPPDGATRAAAVTWLETELDRAAAANPPRGRPMTAHRLNRTEYRNAVRDLIGLDVDVEALLPPDDVSAEGFDNNADTLSTSTTLMERYLTAARRISQLAIGDPAMVSRAATYRVPQAEVQDDRTSEDLPWGTRGGLAVQHHFPLDGEYTIKIGLRRNFYNYIRGLGNTPHQLDVRLDKALVGTFMVGGEYEGGRCPTSYCGLSAGDPGLKEWDWYSVHADDDLEVRLPVKAGTRLVSVAFVKKPAWDEGILQPTASPAAYGYSTDEQQEGNPAVASVVLTGPFDAQAPIETPVRAKIFVCRPNEPGEEAACAEQILGTLARRAYRRPVTSGDVTTLPELLRFPNIHGNHFRRVRWPDDRRAGLLGLGSILTLTSYANRTSPVARGKWILENLMGTPPPEPPANVPGLEEREAGEPPKSLRARMALHRGNPVCASCHRMMDPLGFALENFDAIGRWRTTEETGIPGELGPAIDPSGTTPDGSKFDGAAGLRKILASRGDQFVGTVTERLLTYAVGRKLEVSDMPAVRQIQREAAADESRWSALVLSIVGSRPFQTRRAGS